MNKPINYQTITQNGQPAFVVIPYEEFLHYFPQAKQEASIPHEVVKRVIKDDISTLRAWREYLGFTQRAVADRLGISQAALSQIEAPKSRPRKETLQKIADIYGLTVDQLR